MPRLVHVLLGSALALGLSACGSDGLSKEEYVAQANEICADADTKTDAIAQPTQPADIGPYLQEGAKIQAEAIDKLEALEPPADDADRIEKELIKPYRELVREVRAVREEVEKAGNDQAAVLKSLDALQEIDTETPNDFAVEYGLDECADSQEGEAEGGSAGPSEGSGSASAEPSPSTEG